MLSWCIIFQRASVKTQNCSHSTLATTTSSMWRVWSTCQTRWSTQRVRQNLQTWTCRSVALHRRQWSRSQACCSTNTSCARSCWRITESRMRVLASFLQQRRSTPTFSSSRWIWTQHATNSQRKSSRSVRRISKSLAAKWFRSTNWRFGKSRSKSPSR